MIKVDGRVAAFPSTSPSELRVTVCDPLRGVPRGGTRLKVRKGTPRVNTLCHRSDVKDYAELVVKLLHADQGNGQREA